jgi:hypothetical protein
VNDEAIYAFSPVPDAPAPLKPPAPPKRRRWPWVLGALALLSLLLVVSGAITLVALLNSAHDGMHVSIDGDEWMPGALDGFSGLMAVMGVGIGLLVALFCVLLVVPLTLLLVLLGLVLGLGGAVLAVLLVAALLLSPLWMLLLIVWLILRRPAPKVAVSA